MKRTITVIVLFVGIFQICLSQERYIQDSLDLYGHRPVYHFTSPATRMLDPNGLCFWKGNWHLFYQVLEESDGISIQALSGSARIKNIRAWKMNGIYSE